MPKPKKFDLYVIVGAVAPIAAVVALSICAALFSGPVFHERLLVAVAAGLCGVMGYFAKESYNARKEIREALEGIGVEIGRLQTAANAVRFVAIDDYYATISKCIEAALASGELHELRYGISLTSYRRDNPEVPSEPEARKYHELLRGIIDSGIGVRRIVAVPTIEKLPWVIKQMREIRRPRFSLRLYPGPSGSLVAGTIASLNIQIVGKSHVLCVYSEPGAEQGTNCVHFQSRELNEMFRRYYDSLWNSFGAYWLIREGKANEELLKKLQAEFGVEQKGTRE